MKVAKNTISYSKVIAGLALCFHFLFSRLYLQYANKKKSRINCLIKQNHLLWTIWDYKNYQFVKNNLMNQNYSKRRYVLNIDDIRTNYIRGYNRFLFKAKYFRYSADRNTQ